MKGFGDFFHKFKKKIVITQLYHISQSVMSINTVIDWFQNIWKI
jgi:hypothetical protein